MCEEWIKLIEKLRPKSKFSVEEMLIENLKGMVEFVYSEKNTRSVSYFFHLLNTRLAVEICIEENTPEMIYYRILEKSKEKDAFYYVHDVHDYGEKEAGELAALTKACLDAFATLPSVRLLEATGTLNYHFSENNSLFKRRMEKIIK